MQIQPQSINCQLCGIKILSKCFQIHRRACQKNKLKNTKKATGTKGMLSEMIPCAECGQMIAFNLFSSHLDECVGRQLSKCPQCKILYPTFLLEQHLSICTNFAVQQQQFEMRIQKHSNQSDEEVENEDDQQIYELIMAMAQNMQNEDQPLSPQMIQILRKNIVSKSEDCSICCCTVHSGTQVLKIPCNHIFHVRCMTAWLQKNPHCPMCRRYVLH